MSELSAFEIEGTLNGQREVLVLILAHLLRKGDDGLQEALDERVAFLNQQEDPGAVPHAAFAVEAASTREIKRVLEEARALLRNGD